MNAYITENELDLLDIASEDWENDLPDEYGFEFEKGLNESDFDDTGDCSCRKSDAQSGQITTETYSDENTREFLPAIGAALSSALPAIQAALPVILPMIAQAVPSIAQAAGSLFQQFTKGNAAQPAAGRPKPARPVQSPAASQPVNTNDTLNQLLQALLNLLQNPQVLQTLSNAATGASTALQTVNGIAVPATNLLNVVSQLSGNAAAQIATTPVSNPPAPATVAPTNESVFPDYVFDENGKLLIDPGDPLQHAQLLNEMITAY